MSTPARSKWAIALLIVFMMINFADKAIIGLAAAPLKAELGLDNTQYGTIASSFYLLFSLSAIAFGFLGNRYPGRWLLAGLAVVWSIAQLPIAIPAAGFAALLVTRILLGAGEGPGLPLGMHVAFTWVEQHRRGLTAALLTVGSSLGVIIGAPLLNLAIAGLGWRSAFFILGIVGLVWVIAWLYLGGDGPHSAAAIGPTPTVGTEPRQPYRRLLTTGTWLGTLVSGFAVFWSLALAIAFLPLFLGEVAGYSRAALGYLVALPAVVSLTFMLLGGWFSQRLVRRGVGRHLAQGVLGGAFPLVAGVSMLLLTRMDGGWVLLFAALGFGLGNCQTPLSQAAIADTVPIKQRGAALGVWYGVVSLASIVSPVVTGAIVDAAPDPAAGYRLAFDIAGWMLIAGAVLAMLVTRPDHDAARLGVKAADQTVLTP